MVSKKNKAFAALALASTATVIIICLWPTQKGKNAPETAIGAPGDFQTDNSKFFSHQFALEIQVACIHNLKPYSYSCHNNYDNLCC